MSENMIGKCRIEKVWSSKLRENYAAIVGEVAPADLAKVVQGLEEWFAKNVAPPKLSSCDVCGGWSDEDLPGCPYCGDAEDLDPKTHEPTKRDIDVPPPRPSVTVTTWPDVEHFATAPVNEGSLDEITAVIRDVDRNAAGCTYLVGRLLVLAEQRFWQQRTEGGKPKYKSFDQYCNAELGMSKRHANRLKKVAAEYTQQQVEEFGTTKLYAMLAVPPEERAQLLASPAATAPSVREIEARSSDLRQHKQEAAEANGAPAPGKGTRARGPQKSARQRDREATEACAEAVATNADASHGTIFVPRSAKAEFSEDERTGGWVAELPSKGGANRLRVHVRMNIHGDAPESIEFSVVERDEDDEDEEAAE